jgi:hypothetical protein
MRQRGYAVAFALVLVAIVAGAYFGGRFAVLRFRQDFQFRREWSPPALATPVASAPPELAGPTEAPALATRPKPTQVVVPTPVSPTPEPFATAVATASRTAPVTAPTPQLSRPASESTATATSQPTPPSVEPFAIKGVVRDSQGDCGGTYVLGHVVSHSGEPLPGVRLLLVDDFNNRAFAITKSGQTDLGRYDFPVSGPPRRFSLSVVDEAGAPISRSVSFAYYGNTPDAQATCYWIDWQRQ